jgi:hypothetical protein
MKQAISFEASANTAHGLLLNVALALREYPFTPERMVMVCGPGTRLVRGQMVIPEGCKIDPQSLADRLRKIPGVAKVEPHLLADDMPSPDSHTAPTNPSGRREETTLFTD